jgi:hypothetical protein
LKVAVFPVIVTAPVTDPPALLRRNVVPFTDAASIASENVAVTFALGSIPVAAFAGLITVTVGGVVSGAGSVVNVHTRSDVRLFPARSCTPVVTRAVYVVLYASAPVGLNVAVFPDIVTAPATDPPVLLRRNDVPLTEATSIASENVAVTFPSTSTPVAPLAGTVVTTLGGVTSGADPVVNDQTRSAAR